MLYGQRFSWRWESFRYRMNADGTWIVTDIEHYCRVCFGLRMTYVCMYCISMFCIQVHRKRMKKAARFWVSSCRNSTRQKAFFAEIRAAYPQYRIAIIHVFASWDVMQQRSSVVREGGRVTSPKALRTSFDAVTKAVAELEPAADLTLHINNDGLEPRLIDVSQAGVRVKLKWKGIRELFQQAPGLNFRFFKTIVLFMMVTGLACFLPLLQAGSEVQKKSCFPFLNS